jgi:tetratricopeptide (TPR) repeat protein
LTVVYAGYHLRQWKRGFRLNLRKAALLAAFLFASWYLYVWVEDFIFGFAVWSAFHCIQYFGIVWAFNESRVRNSNQVAGLLQPLFRPGFVPVLAYVALILAYGAVNYGTGFLSDPAVRNLMMSFIITSGALHYYYDGFIWKVREKDTRRHLRIQPDAPLQAAKPDQPPLRFAAGWAHVSLLALILGSLAVLESLNSTDEVTLRQALVAASPQAAVGYRNLGGALRDRGLIESAAGAYERAAKESPQDAAVRHQLGLTLAELGRLEEALRAFESALRLDPGLSEAHYNTGVLLARMGKADPALQHLRKAFPNGDAAALDAVAKRPGGAEALNNLGLGTLQSGDRQLAGEMFQRALSADPGNVEARVNSANLLLIDGKLAEARSHFEEALRLAPQHPTARNNLGLLLLRLGKDSEARPHLEFALRHGGPEVSSSARKALAGIDGDSLR